MDENQPDLPQEKSPEFASESDPTTIFVPVSEQALSMITPDQAESMAGMVGYALIVQRGPETGKTWLLSSGDTDLGRHPSNDIVLDDITVSRRHCKIRITKEKVSLLDVGSTNGSYVNGQRVDAAPLVPGDRLLIGKFHLLVAHGDG